MKKEITAGFLTGELSTVYLTLFVVTSSATDNSSSVFFILFSFFFFNLTYSRWTSSLPSCLWSQRIFPSLPGSRLTIFYRDASSALFLQLVNQWLNFTSSRSHAFRYERKNTYPSLVRIELTTSAPAGVQVSYLLDHSGYTKKKKKKKKKKKNGAENQVVAPPVKVRKTNTAAFITLLTTTSSSIRGISSSA